MSHDEEPKTERQDDTPSELSLSEHGLSQIQKSGRLLDILEKKTNYDYEISKEVNANEGKMHENVRYRLVTERKAQYASLALGGVFIFAFFAFLGYAIYRDKPIQWGYIPLLFALLSIISGLLTNYLSNKKK